MPEGSAETSRLLNGPPSMGQEALHFEYNPMNGREGTVYEFNFLYRTRSTMIHIRFAFFANDYRNTPESGLHTT